MTRHCIARLEALWFLISRGEKHSFIERNLALVSTRTPIWAYAFTGMVSGGSFGLLGLEALLRLCKKRFFFFVSKIIKQFDVSKLLCTRRLVAGNRCYTK